MTVWPATGAGAETTAAEPNLVSPGRLFRRRLALGLCVGLILVFSQGWVLFITGPNGDPEASTLIRAVYFPWYAVAAGLLLARPSPSFAAALRAPLIWALLAVAACSMLWSIDPGVTERRLVAVLFTTLAGFAIASRYDWADLAETLAIAYAVLATASFLVGLFAPGYGRMSEIFPGSWRGLYFDKNGLGDGMTLGFMAMAAAAVLKPERRRLWAAFAGLAVLLVLLSTSKTSLVALMIGVSAFAAVVVARRGPAAAVAVTFLGVVAIALVAGLIVFDTNAMLGLLGKDATLSGRTRIWAAVLQQIHARPWTGYGYGAVWTDESGWGPLAWIMKQTGFRPRHAHDGWLETWLGLGYVGLAVWAALFVQTMGRAVRTVYRSPGAYLALPILTVYALETLTESVVFVYNDLFWLIFTVLAVKLALPDAPLGAGEGGDVRLASVAP